MRHEPPSMKWNQNYETVWDIIKQARYSAIKEIRKKWFGKSSGKHVNMHLINLCYSLQKVRPTKPTRPRKLSKR